MKYKHLGGLSFVINAQSTICFHGFGQWRSVPNCRMLDELTKLNSEPTKPKPEGPVLINMPHLHHHLFSLLSCVKQLRLGGWEESLTSLPPDVACECHSTAFIGTEMYLFIKHYKNLPVPRTVPSAEGTQRAGKNIGPSLERHTPSLSHINRQWWKQRHLRALMVQWLWLCAHNSGSLGSNPWSWN